MLALRLWFSIAWGTAGGGRGVSQPVECQSLLLKDYGPAVLIQNPLTTPCPPVFSRIGPSAGKLVWTGGPGRTLRLEQGSWVLRPRRGWARGLWVSLLRGWLEKGHLCSFRELSGFSPLLRRPSNLPFLSPGLSAEKKAIGTEVPLAPAHICAHKSEHMDIGARMCKCRGMSRCAYTCLFPKCKVPRLSILGRCTDATWTI